MNNECFVASIDGITNLVHLLDVALLQVASLVLLYTYVVHTTTSTVYPQPTIRNTHGTRYFTPTYCTTVIRVFDRTVRPVDTVRPHTTVWTVRTEKDRKIRRAVVSILPFILLACFSLCQ